MKQPVFSAKMYSFTNNPQVDVEERVQEYIAAHGKQPKVVVPVGVKVSVPGVVVKEQKWCQKGCFLVGDFTEYMLD
jgi:hypothetical protein